MSDGFDPSPHAPLPTEGEFRTSYAKSVWWVHTGKHFLFGLGLLLASCVIIVVIKSPTMRSLIALLALACFLGIVWGFILLYRNRRLHHQRVVIDWKNQAVHFEGIRSQSADLLDPDSTSLTLAFEEIRRAQQLPAIYSLPPRICVSTGDDLVNIQLHLDDIDGLLARLSRIGEETSTTISPPCFKIDPKDFGCTPATMLIILAVIGLMAMIVAVTWP